MEEEVYMNFKNGEAPALKDETLNQLQKMIKNDIKEKTTKNQLWTNPSPNLQFNTQEITLNNSNFNYLIIFFYRNYASQTDTRAISVLVEKGKKSEAIYSDYFESKARVWTRQVEFNNNKVVFSDATINGETNNFILVPYKILGFN